MIIEELFEGKANLKSLYMARPVLNHEAFREWARDNGFKSTLPGEDLHVTITYCKPLFDWDSTEPDQEILYIEPDEDREIHVFDGGATVLHFHDDRLSDRWQEMIDLGAKSSYPDYKAHITISYKGRPKSARPYTGEIILGPEEWREINDDWREEMVEATFD